jgi:hypothetical protein
LAKEVNFSHGQPSFGGGFAKTTLRWQKTSRENIFLYKPVVLPNRSNKASSSVINWIMAAEIKRDDYRTFLLVESKQAGPVWTGRTLLTGFS